MYIVLQTLYCCLTALLLEVPAYNNHNSEPVVMSIPAPMLNNDIGQNADTTIQTELLLTYIQIEQLILVRKSIGVYDHQCFTDNNLAEFMADSTANLAVKHLQSDKIFTQRVLPTLISLPLSNWLDLKRKALLTRRPTWAEIKKIDERGTTKAGALAESHIAETIINWIEEMR